MQYHEGFASFQLIQALTEIRIWEGRNQADYMQTEEGLFAIDPDYDFFDFVIVVFQAWSEGSREDINFHEVIAELNMIGREAFNKSYLSDVAINEVFE